MHLVLTLSYNQSYVVNADQLTKVIAVLENAIPVSEEYIDGETVAVRNDKQNKPRMTFVDKLLSKEQFENLREQLEAKA